MLIFSGGKLVQGLLGWSYPSLVLAAEFVSVHLVGGVLDAWLGYRDPGCL